MDIAHLWMFYLYELEDDRYIFCMEISDQKYCFWDAKSLEDTCALIVNAGVAAVVLLISCYRLIKFRKLGYESNDRHLRICSELHLLTSLWGLSNSALN